MGHSSSPISSRTMLQMMTLKTRLILALLSLQQELVILITTISRPLRLRVLAQVSPVQHAQALGTRSSVTSIQAANNEIGTPITVNIGSDIELDGLNLRFKLSNIFVWTPYLLLLKCEQSYSISPSFLIEPAFLFVQFSISWLSLLYNEVNVINDECTPVYSQYHDHGGN